MYPSPKQVQGCQGYPPCRPLAANLHSCRHLGQPSPAIGRAKGRDSRAGLGDGGHDRGLGTELCESGGRARRRRRIVSELLQGLFVEVERVYPDALEAAHEAGRGGADEEGSQQRQTGADDAYGRLDHRPVHHGSVHICSSVLDMRWSCGLGGSYSSGPRIPHSILRVVG